MNQFKYHASVMRVENICYVLLQIVPTVEVSDTTNDAKRYKAGKQKTYVIKPMCLECSIASSLLLKMQV